MCLPVFQQYGPGNGRERESQGHERKEGPVHRYEKLDNNTFPLETNRHRGFCVWLFWSSFSTWRLEEYASAWNAVCFVEGVFAVRPFTSVASLEYGLEGDRERERELKRGRT